MKNGVLLALISAAVFASQGAQACDMPRLELSQTLIQHMLDDIEQNYDLIDGELTSIKATATWTYDVGISHEERKTILHYSFAVSPSCEISLIEKSESTKSYGH